MSQHRAIKDSELPELNRSYYNSYNYTYGGRHDVYVKSYIHVYATSAGPNEEVTPQTLVPTNQLPLAEQVEVLQAYLAMGNDNITVEHEPLRRIR